MFFFFQILAEIKMTRNENRLFARHFETVQIFYIKKKIFPEIWLWLVYNGVKIIKKFRCKSGFLGGGVHDNPPCTLTEVQGALCS